MRPIIHLLVVSDIGIDPFTVYGSRQQLLRKARPSRTIVKIAQSLTCISLVTFAVAVLFLTNTAAAATKNFADAGSIKGTVSATTAAVSANTRPTLVSGAKVKLVNRDLPSQVHETTTDDTGSFIFVNLPAAVYELTVEAGGAPSVTQELRLSFGATLYVEVVLTASVNETVVVRAEEGLLSTAETTTSNVVRAETLKTVPLRAENFQSALPLTPGIVRGSNGFDYVKGARAGQSAYTVNGADVTDPVTGELAFDIPIEAAASVQIEENPYGAEFGRLTGGATNLETNGGGDKFKISAARFFPTFRNILSGPIDSFRPRVTLSGRIIKDRLYFLQSFEYRFTRTRVPNLPEPFDDSTSENFNSYTQLDLNIDKNNQMKFVAAVFPEKVRHAGLNTFNPQPVTPNTKQRGELFFVSEQAIFRDASFLSSRLSYKSFSVDIFGQGPLPLTLTPDLNLGNYFGGTHRDSPRVQWQETYYARPFKFHGQHSLKTGMELDLTRVTGSYTEKSILIRRSNGTLAQRIDFSNESAFRNRGSEFAAFVQDRWVVSPKLTIDAGVRFDRDGIIQRSNVAPRLSFLFLPFKNDRTIIRGGIGIFYDRTPFSVGYFTQLPERIVTRFATDGVTVTDAARRFVNVIEEPLRNPRSVRWSLQVDRGLTHELTARIGYLERSTTHDFLIEPRVSNAIPNTLALNSQGRSRYRELQLLVSYEKPRLGNWNASYTWSSARGDLNTVDNFLGDFPAFVVRRNEYAPLSFDAPHRFLVFGTVKTKYDISISPAVEIRSGFPFSLVNEQLDYVSERNRAGRFPIYMSVDLQVTKGFAIPKFVPIVDGRRARIGVAVFNVTSHFNPRDVQQNTGSLQVGQFFNSLGTSVRGKFELEF